MKSENYEKLFRALSAPCRGRRLVLIMTIALFAASCATTTKTKTTTVENRETAYEAKTVRITHQAVPSSQARLQVPIAEIQKLPDGAVFAAKSGQAQAKVRIRNDTIIIIATCDSLQREVEYYEAALSTALSSIKRLEAEKTERMSLKTGIIAILIVAILIAGTVILIKFS
jgi:hypothetical protein